MKFFFALDGSHTSEFALEFVKKSGFLKKSEAYLFHSIPTLHLITKSAYEKLIEQEAYQAAKEYLEEKKAELETICKKVEILIYFGDPKETILEASQDVKPDLIVMGTKGLTGLTRVLIGSVAQHIIAHSKIPVLVVPHQD